jgi:hypothetical protein
LPALWKYLKRPPADISAEAGCGRIHSGWPGADALDKRLADTLGRGHLGRRRRNLEMDSALLEQGLAP